MALANPWGFLALVGIPLILYFHRRSALARRAVPLVSLWRPGASAAVRRADRRLRDPVLWLRLLFVTAVALALARPSWPAAGGRRHVFLMDGSASMWTREPGGPRFGQAAEAATRVLERLPGGDEVMILRAGAPPSVAHALSRDRRSLADAVAALRPGEASKDLPSALALARREAGGGGAVVHVFSDLRDPAGLARLGGPLGFAAADLRLHAVGGAAENVALVALDAAPLPLSPLDNEVFAQVANFSGTGRTVEVVLALPDGLGEQRRRLTLGPGARAPVVFVVPAAPWVEVRLEGNEDALPLDDRATLVLPAARLRVLYASRGDRFLGAALRAHPRLQVQEVPAARLREASVSPGTADVAVLDGVRVSPTFALPALIFAPAPPGEAGGARAVAVEDWQREHPLARQLDLTEVVVPAGAVLAGADAGVFLRSTDGAVARAFTLAGQRRVEFAFAVGASNLGRLPAFPVLVARALDWLAERGGATPRNLRAGEPLRAALGQEPRPGGVTVRRPDGSAATPTVEAGTISFAGTEATGLYTVAGAGSPWHFAVNLLDADESNVNRSPAGPQASTPPAVGGAAGRDLAGPLLALVALPVLSLEICLLRRKARLERA